MGNLPKHARAGAVLTSCERTDPRANLCGRVAGEMKTVKGVGNLKG
jgi:hypothetical protein